jgi:hypothetical protein
MVNFDIFVDNRGRIAIRTIDDAEGTPGMSRQYTRFNAECKPELVKYWNDNQELVNLNTKEYRDILKRHEFRHVQSVTLDSGDVTRVCIDSIEA